MKRLFSVWIMTVLAAPAFASEWMPVQQFAASKPQAESLQPMPVSKSYFNITMQDVEAKVAQAMVDQGVAEHVEAFVMPSGTPVLWKANHPIDLIIHSLQVYPEAKRWQAQAYVVANGKTETIQPIAGRYDELMNVPMLKRQMGSKDVIELEDIELRLVASRKLRKDTVTDVDQLIGKSARQMISASRMIRSKEVVEAIAVEKDRPVEMIYATPYMSIRTMGKALENGSKGEMIRVMNSDTQRTVSARIVDTSRVEVTPTVVMN